MLKKMKPSGYSFQLWFILPPDVRTELCEFAQAHNKKPDHDDCKRKLVSLLEARQEYILASFIKGKLREANVNEDVKDYDNSLTTHEWSEMICEERRAAAAAAGGPQSLSPFCAAACIVPLLYAHATKAPARPSKIVKPVVRRPSQAKCVPSKRIQLSGILNGWTKELRCTANGRKYDIFYDPDGKPHPSRISAERSLGLAV